jgi:V-type H+-transporting ATPase subunit a
MEINPSIVSSISFPFLFGVMFGDIASGFLVFCGGFVLFIFEDKIKENKKFALLT